MNNAKGYLKLEQKRCEIEEWIMEYDTKIQNIREEAKKLPKGSIERKHMMTEVQELGKNVEYRHMKDKLRLMNFCINSVFYS